jgi:hypothetical protein
MTDTTRRLHNTKPRRARARGRHAASFSDAVIAAYVHELRRAAMPSRARSPVAAASR